MFLFKITPIHICLCALLALASMSCAAIEPTTEASNAITSESTQAEAPTTDGDESWSARAREVLVNALSLTGVKYTYGGNTPETGFDCSGFVRYVFQHASSLTLPRTALAMSQLGTTVPKDALKPGDLVFFHTLKAAFSHVGIYLGNNRFIHAPRTGSVVRIESLNSSYWAERYSGAKRIDNNQASINQASN